MPSSTLPHHIQDLDHPPKKWYNSTWFWIILVTIILLVLVGGGVLIFFLTKNDVTDPSRSTDKPNTVPPDVGTTPPIILPTFEICTTSSCKDDAAKLINAMNTSVDPCQDFFEYACGGFNAENQGKDTDDIMYQQLSDSNSNILKAENDLNDPSPVNQARDFYAACTNSELREKIGLRPLIDLLEVYGGWPMTLESWAKENFSWLKTTADMRVLYNTNVFITVYNDFSHRDSSHNAIHIDQATLILPKDELIHGKGIEKYNAFITGAAKEIRDALKSTVTDSQIEKDVTDLLKFESALAFITTPSEDTRRSFFGWMYTPMTLDDLQEWTDRVTTSTAYAKINWFNFINRIYNQGAGIDIPKTERIIVSETRYLQNLVALLDKTPLRTIANYVHWNLVYRLTGTTNERMRYLNHQFNGRSMSLDGPCADEANEFLGFAVSHKYVDSSFYGVK